MELFPHTIFWSEAFELEKKRISSELAVYLPTIEHIGSTAIIGIASKPIIDIAVGLPKYDFAELAIQKLANLGYSSRGFRSDGLGTILELKDGKNRTHCIHLLDMSKPRWDDCIFFRDTLQNNSKLRTEYQDLKKELSQKYKNDRQKYTQEKNIFVGRILAMR